MACFKYFLTVKIGLASCLHPIVHYFSMVLLHTDIQDKQVDLNIQTGTTWVMARQQLVILNIICGNAKYLICKISIFRYGGSVPAPIHRGVSAPVPSREFHPSVANGGGGYFSPPSTRSNDNNVSLANLAAKLDSVRVNDEVWDFLGDLMCNILEISVLN